MHVSGADFANGHIKEQTLGFSQLDNKHKIHKSIYSARSVI